MVKVRGRMSTPAVALSSWLKKQEVEVQEDIAFQMLYCMPGPEVGLLPTERDELLAKLYGTIDAHSGSEVKNPSFVVAFAAVFDHLFSRTRGTAEGWDRPKAIFESILEDENAPAGIREHARRSLDELPGRRDKWMAIIRSWRDLKSTALTEDALEAWASESLLKRGNPVSAPLKITI